MGKVEVLEPVKPTPEMMGRIMVQPPEQQAPPVQILKGEIHSSD
jgi:hypothetical protein